MTPITFYISIRPGVEITFPGFWESKHFESTVLDIAADHLRKTVGGTFARWEITP